MLKRFFFALFSLFLCTNKACAKCDVAEFALKNGLHVVHIKKSTAPIVNFSIWYLCGSQCDAISKSGVAHFLEHMAFCSNDESFDELLEKIGAERNGVTSLKTVCFYEIVPTEHIETVFEHEAKRMESFAPNKAKFPTEKGAILEERNMRIDNNPEGQFSEISTSTLFNRMPGGISTIGWKHEIESITEEDLADFHNKWFCPNNAVIIIAGDIELSEVRHLTEKYFGSLSKKPLSKPNALETSFNVKKEVSFSSPKLGSEFLVVYTYRVPFSIKSDFRKCLSLEIAIEIMNQPDSFIGKVLENVVDKDSSISLQYTQVYHPYDTVRVSIVGNSVNTYADNEKIWTGYLKNEISRIKIKKADLDAIKKQKLLASAYRYDDIGEIVPYFGYHLVRGLSLDQIKSIDDTIQSLTVEECEKALKEVFSEEPYAVLRMTPKGYDREQE